MRTPRAAGLAIAGLVSLGWFPVEGAGAPEGMRGQQAGPPREAARSPEAARSQDTTRSPRAPRARGTLEVGPSGSFRSIGAALAAASPGDTILVRSGRYRERLRIEIPVTLLGTGRPVIDGGGEGHVIEALAPVTIRGFDLRGSGTRVDAEHAGIMVRGARAVLEHNRLDDVLYGIYLKEAPGSLVRRNRVRGKPLAPPRRGDGIRLWQSARSRLLDNVVEGTRDVVIYFSDALRVSGNTVTDGRYGLHYMYSHDTRIEDNRFERNEVGAFLMYSRGLVLAGNAFLDSRGATAVGIGLKDADDVRVVDNLIVGNDAGMHLDNSPSSVGRTNRIERNLIAFNRVGVRTLPSVRGNEFEGNDLIGNSRPAEVAGGVRAGQAERNRWHGNHWDGHAGFDSDGDGVGDRPFVYARLSDELRASRPALEVFSGSPALGLLEVLARFFPLLAPEPLVIDSAPRLEPRATAHWSFGASPPVDRARGRAGGGGAPEVGLWATLASLAAGLAVAASIAPAPVRGGAVRRLRRSGRRGEARS